MCDLHLLRKVEKTVEKGDVGALATVRKVCMVLEIDAVECQVVRIFYTLNHKLVTEVCSLNSADDRVGEQNALVLVFSCT